MYCMFWRVYVFVILIKIHFNLKALPATCNKMKDATFGLSTKFSKLNIYRKVAEILTYYLKTADTVVSSTFMSQV